MMQQNYDAKKERGQGLFMVNLKLTGHPGPDIYRQTREY